MQRKRSVMGEAQEVGTLFLYACKGCVHLCVYVRVGGVVSVTACASYRHL